MSTKTVIQPSFVPTPGCKFTEEQLRSTWFRILDLERDIVGRDNLNTKTLLKLKRSFEKNFLFIL